jgi:pimeloyl-ACP methyl ester carboxylesterase
VRTTYRDGWVRAASLDLHYVAWGDPSNPPLVLLHGLTENAHTFDFAAQWLAEGFAVYALDFRDHGESDATATAPTLGDLVQDVKDVVAGLGLRRFGLLGHSMGGRVALAYASRHTDEVAWLVIEDAPPSITPQAEALVAAFLRSLPERFADLGAVQRFLRPAMPSAGPEFLQHRALTSRAPLAGGTSSLKFTMPTSTALGSDLWDRLGRLPMPLVVLRGKGSKVLLAEEAERMAAQAPHGRLVTVERAGHVIHADNPAGYRAALEGFLEEVAPEA